MISSRKVSKPGVFSGPYFPVFGGNTEIYRVNLYIQSEYRKLRTRKNSGFGHFSRTNHNANATSYRKYKHCDSDKSKTNVSDRLSLEDTLTLDTKVSKDTFIDSPDKNPLFKRNN